MKKIIKKIVTKNEEETWNLAKDLSKDLLPGSIIALHGQLGAGKTCFVQGLALALGVKDPITSPTYTLIDEYDGIIKLIHIDLYRLSNSTEALGIGIEEYLEMNAIVAIEWAERASDILPDNLIHIEITPSDDTNTRIIEIYKMESSCV